MKNNRKLTNDQLKTNVDYLESHGFYIEDQDAEEMFCIETMTGRRIDVYIYVDEPSKEALLNYFTNLDVEKEAREYWEGGYCSHNSWIHSEEDMREDLQKFIDDSIKIVENMEF